MTPEQANGAIFALSVLVWPIALLVEAPAILARAKDRRFKTISMVLRDKTWQLTFPAYLMGGMGTHWFWPSPFYAPDWCGVVFWLIPVGLLVQDVFLWSRPKETWPKWLQRQRWPFGLFVLGMVCGAVLFPQKGLNPWI